MRALPLLCLALTACAVDDATGDPTAPGGGKADDGTTPHRLPGHDETLLAGDARGKLVRLHVGETFSATPIDTGERTSPEVIEARAGVFYALYRDGSLAIIDDTDVRKLELPTGALDIEWASDGELYVSLASGAIARIDLATGAQVGRIDLAASRGTAANIEPRHLRRVGDRLYVQIARSSASGRAAGGAVAVIANDTIERVIELQAIDDTGAGLTGVSPDLPMALDEQRGILYVTALGERPSSTGGLFRIDTARAQLHDAKRAQSGFQGAAVLGAPWSTAYLIYHTSTPTTSSHLFDYRIAGDGALEPTDGGALVDTFDGLDALAIDADGALVAMANTCITGFCIRGAGIAFIDARTGEVLPKLLANQIGFEPSVVAFLR